MPKFNLQLLGSGKTNVFLARVLLWAISLGHSECFPSSQVSKLLFPVYFFLDVVFQNRFEIILLLSFRFLLSFAQPSLLHGHHMLSSLYGLPMVTLCPILPASSPVCLLSLPASTIPLSTLEWAPNFEGIFSSCSIVPRKSRILWSSNVLKTSSKNNKSPLRKERSTQKKCTQHQALIPGWVVQPTPHLQQTGKCIWVFPIHYLITLILNVIDCKFCSRLTRVHTLCNRRPSSSDQHLSDFPIPSPSVSCYNTDDCTAQANHTLQWHFHSM